MDMDALAAAVRARREAQGLKSTYQRIDGSGTFDMFHPNVETKAYEDFKHALRAKYPTEELCPKADLIELSRLRKIARGGSPS